MELNDISASDMTSLNAQGYTEGDLAMLAKSEVAALLAVPAESDDGSESGNIASPADPHGTAEAEQDAAVVVASPVAMDTAEDTADAPFIPQYSAEVPADAKQQIAALNDEESAAFKKLMDGEIDADEYKKVRDRTSEAVDDLKTKAITASIFEQANQQAAQQVAQTDWNRAEAASFATFKAEGIDYKGKPSLLAAFNVNLKALGIDPKNERRDAPWFLTEAHRLTKDDLGFRPVAKITPSTARNGVDPAEIPPTLRSVPIAATGAVNADEFAHMRNLSGLDLERAHARLTNDQRDRWMAE
jgi:hypothetical protein